MVSVGLYRGIWVWQVSLSVELLVLTDQSSISSRHTMQYTEVIQIHVYGFIHTFKCLYVHEDTHIELMYIHMFPEAISTALQPN